MRVGGSLTKQPETQRCSVTVQPERSTVVTVARFDLHIDATELVSSGRLDMTELQETCEERSTSVYAPCGNVGWCVTRPMSEPAGIFQRSDPHLSLSRGLAGFQTERFGRSRT